MLSDICNPATPDIGVLTFDLRCVTTTALQ